MKKRALRKTVTLFTLLAFLGSLFPCACLAEATPSTSAEKAQTHSSSHDCCDSENSENKESSDQSSNRDDCCCSGCHVFVAATSSDIVSSVASSSEHSPNESVFTSGGLTDFQVSGIHLLPRGSPPTRTPYLTSSSVLAATLCRWLI